MAPDGHLNNFEKKKFLDCVEHTSQKKYYRYIYKNHLAQIQ